jgi:hypothetical protein
MTKYVDITFTVKETVANGRRLLRNQETGEQVWSEGPIIYKDETADHKVVVEAPTVVDEQTFVPNPITKGEPENGKQVRSKARRR